MAAPLVLEPYRQGQLDGLCCIYAIINAIQFALRSQHTDVSPSDWRELFYVLLAAADDSIGALQATTCGIGIRPFRKLLRLAVRHMADEHQVVLFTGPVLMPGASRTFQESLGDLEAITSEVHTALLVEFKGKFAHWTVISGVSGGWLQLFDSSGIDRICIASCRMAYQPRCRGTLEHVMRSPAMFRISADPMKRS